MSRLTLTDPIARDTCFTYEETSHRRALIVEDEPFWQMLIEKSLRMIDPNIKIQLATNVREANRKIQNDEYGFDLVIADQMLAGQETGLDLWDQLCEKEISIPFCLLSGYGRKEFFQNLKPHRKNAVPRFIEKASSIQALVMELRSAFQNLPRSWERKNVAGEIRAI